MSIFRRKRMEKFANIGKETCKDIRRAVDIYETLEEKLHTWKRFLPGYVDSVMDCIVCLVMNNNDLRTYLRRIGDPNGLWE